MKKLQWIMCIVALLLIEGLASADIIINEVMPHNNNTLGNEWIEIYNNGSEEISLIGWILTDSSLSDNDTLTINISSGGFALVVDNNVTFENDTGCAAVSNYINDSDFICQEIPQIGNGLSDTGDSVILFNGSAKVANFSYNSNIRSTGKSWSLNESGSWKLCLATPGFLNNCTTSQTCTQNWSCSSWSSCSNGKQTRTCTDLNNCGNNTGKPDENKSCEDEDITIELEWDEDEIVNGKEFEINVKANNLESGEDYDIKVEIQNEDKDTISETYGNHGEDEDNWETSRNYLLEVFSGGGDKSEKIKLRIDQDYDDFKGDATIIAKIRKTDTTSAIDEFEDEIKILEKVNDSSSTISSSSLSSRNSNLSNSSAGGTADLGSKSQTKEYNKNSIVYKSPSEYIKEYAPYSFSLFCIILIALLLMDKYKIRIRIEKGEETENV